MKPRIAPLLAAAVLTVLAWITACASIKGLSRIEAFEQVSKQYKHTLMSSDFEAALRITPSDSRIETEAFNNIRVVYYDVKKIVVSEDKSHVFQEVELKYYRTDTMIQKRLRDQQQWTYDPDSKKWILSSGLPKFQ